MVVCNSNLRAFVCNLRDAKLENVFLRVFDLKNLSSPEMSCRDMVINVLGFHTRTSYTLIGYLPNFQLLPQIPYE